MRYKSGFCFESRAKPARGRGNLLIRNEMVDRWSVTGHSPFGKVTFPLSEWSPGCPDMTIGKLVGEIAGARVEQDSHVGVSVDRTIAYLSAHPGQEAFDLLLAPSKHS